MSQVQSGILPEHCRAAIWIEANVKGKLTPCVRPVKHLPTNWQLLKRNSRTRILVRWLPLVTTPLARSERRRWGRRAERFSGYGKGLAPTTQFDVLIHIFLCVTT